MASKGKIAAVWMKRKANAWQKPFHLEKRRVRKPAIRRGPTELNGKYAWEVDHKWPKSKGGSDRLRNLQPLHRDENRAKGAKPRHKGR